MIRLTFLTCPVVLFAANLLHGDYMDDAQMAFVGKKVDRILNYFGTKEGDLRFFDEPPGKLCAISFLIDKNLQIYVGIKYSPEVFSAERKWDIKKVRDRSIVSVKFLIPKGKI